jgi:hypothetical protein
VLEAFVQFSPARRIELPDVAAVRIKIPDEASSVEVHRSELPGDLRSSETMERCRQLGDGWLAAAEHLVLVAPSLIVPQECNVMVNPAHRLMTEVRIVSVESFRFDPRLATPRT